MKGGEVVWLLDHKIKTRKADEKKMLNPRTGPFMIKRVTHDGQNAILYMGGGQTKRINVRLLQPHGRTQAVFQNTIGDVGSDSEILNSETVTFR